jgi:hypothetical protein
MAGDVFQITGCGDDADLNSQEPLGEDSDGVAVCSKHRPDLARAMSGILDRRPRTSGQTDA